MNVTLLKKDGKKEVINRVEIAAMANAINKAWKTSDPDDLYKYYTARIDLDRGSPTVSEFIFYYANKLTYL